jgi:hypothetical protein
MPTRIHFRSDSWHIADLRAQGEPWVPYLDWMTPEQYAAVPPASPGDTWRVRWHGGVDNPGGGPIAGYAICCPQCGRVHTWTGANNCSQKRPDGYCIHNGTGSCWVWTGSPEAVTLTASPSLHAPTELGGCGFHGWLQNGILTP